MVISYSLPNTDFHDLQSFLLKDLPLSSPRGLAERAFDIYCLVIMNEFVSNAIAIV